MVTSAKILWLQQSLRQIRNDFHIFLVHRPSLSTTVSHRLSQPSISIPHPSFLFAPRPSADERYAVRSRFFLLVPAVSFDVCLTGQEAFSSCLVEHVGPDEPGADDIGGREPLDRGDGRPADDQQPLPASLPSTSAAPPPASSSPSSSSSSTEQRPASVPSSSSSPPQRAVSTPSSVPPQSSAPPAAAPSSSSSSQQPDVSSAVVTVTPSNVATSVQVVTSTTTRAPVGGPSTTSSAASSSTSSAAAELDSSNSASGGGLNQASKVAIGVVVPIAAIAFLAIVGLFWWKKRRARQEAEEERRKEVEDYSYNPNADPTMPAVGHSVEHAYEMKDEGGYRGWGSTATTTGSRGRKASTTMSGGAAGTYSDPASPIRANLSEARSGEPLVDGSSTHEGEILGAMGPSAANNRGGDVRRGPSNASSSYSAAARSDGSDGAMYGNGAAYYEQYGQNPYSEQRPQEAGSQAVIRDNPARRNTRIENSAHYPQQSAGIAQNF
ncbi:hypothetical protein XA68_15526 [Ophiocordyceps unilateralis]|uniref:Mid2 domain-containing protein n=1 Tax=Ophiocordyceps unilateralis TaxID=268505 RepID=A0A2A9PL90_OPHUN|nr:hypothetical protein XA68_15526 [Ophiocordyceps unilateralis]